MPDYSIKLTLPNVRDVQQIFNSAVFPLVSQAVHAIAQEAASNLTDAVMTAPLWQQEKIAYVQSIRIEYGADGLHADVIADYDNAGPIETGRPARDLKKMLDTSDKVRRTKDGRRFLVIPMRKNTPGNTAHAPAMPTSVYELASKMKLSSVTGSGTRPSGEEIEFVPGAGIVPLQQQSPFLSNPTTKAANLVPKSTYQWGERLTGKMLAAAGVSKTDARLYKGMVRMEDGTGGSPYLTFRIMMEGSSGWLVPAKPGLYLARGVAEHLQPIAQAAINEAMEQTSKS